MLEGSAISRQLVNIPDNVSIALDFKTTVKNTNKEINGMKTNWHNKRLMRIL